MDFEFDIHEKEYCTEKLQLDQVLAILRKLEKDPHPWFILHGSDNLTCVAPAEDVTFTSLSYSLITFKSHLQDGGGSPEFLFRITEALAAANIPFLTHNSFDRLHILVDKAQVNMAERVLKAIKIVK